MNAHNPVRIRRTLPLNGGVAVVLPADLGIAPNEDVRVFEEDGRIVIERVPIDADAPRRKIDLTGIWGSCPDIKLLTPEDREFEDRELDWDGKLLPRE